jgi:hypothetical protein
MIPTSGSKGEQ